MNLKQALFSLFICTSVFAQAPGQSKPSFEVASIRPNNSGEIGMSISLKPGGRFVATNVPLWFVLTYAYRVREFQVIGGPDWIRSDRWDIQARAEEGSVPRDDSIDPRIPDQIALRTQLLVEDRFQLKFHRETRELPVYELTVTKGGPKIKLSDDQTPPRPNERGDKPSSPESDRKVPRGEVHVGSGQFEASAMEFGTFVYVFSLQFGRTIMDKTGLKGLYDIKLQWTPELGQEPGTIDLLPGATAPVPPSEIGPSIFTAIQEQLGLKLESTKGPVDVLVIDSVQKPTGN